MKTPRGKYSYEDEQIALRKLQNAAKYMRTSVLEPQETISIELLPSEQSVLYANRKIMHVVMRETGVNVKIKPKAGMCDALTFKGSEEATLAAKTMMCNYVSTHPSPKKVNHQYNNIKDDIRSAHKNHMVVTDPSSLSMSLSSVVLDGPNIARHRDGAIANMNDVFEAVQFFLRGGISDVKVVFPESYMGHENDRNVRYKLKGKSKLDYLRRNEYIICSSQPMGPSKPNENPHDDLLCIVVAMRKNANIISNDKFRREIDDLKDSKIADFILRHRVSFSFSTSGKFKIFTTDRS